MREGKTKWTPGSLRRMVKVGEKDTRGNKIVSLIAHCAYKRFFKPKTNYNILTIQM